MDKCSCWEKKKVYTGWYGVTPIYYKIKQICNGTKEQDECSCDGDVTKCNFYSEKRKENRTMNTAEMWIKAQEDGKTYKCMDMRYNKSLGFHDENKSKWCGYAFNYVNDIFSLQWDVYLEEMTKSEAEDRFNIKIVGD